MWTTVLLRGAGFPAEMVLELAAPLATHLADELLASELKAESEGRTSTAQIQEIEKRYTAQLATDLEEISARIRKLASGEKFREAVVWQNLGAYRTAIEKLVRGSTKKHKTRQRERLAVSYLQRYCTKNDTIGFFGPAAWGHIENAPLPALTAVAGPDLLALRRTHFEHWAIGTLSRHLLEQEPNLFYEFIPTVGAMCIRRGSTIETDRGDLLELTKRQSQIIDLCDGERRVKEIVAELGNDINVFEEIQTLARMRALSCDFALPRTYHPEQDLNRILEQVEDATSRARCLESTRQLNAARQEVQRAAGNPDALIAALDQLNQCFEQLTEASSTRRAGQAYSGRTLVFEECRRDISLSIGRSMIDELANGLRGVLRSIRWLSHQIERHERDVFNTCFDQLRTSGDDGRVPGPHFVKAVYAAIGTIHSKPAFGEMLGQMNERWRSLLQSRMDTAASSVVINPQEFDEMTRAAFEAPRCARTKRFSSPDILIVAPDAQAVEKGDYLLVVGEVHPFVETVSPLLETHPNPDQVLRDWDVLNEGHATAGLAAPNPIPEWLNPAGKGEYVDPPTRACWYMRDRNFTYLQVGVGGQPHGRSVALGELWAERQGDQIFLVSEQSDFRIPASDLDIRTGLTASFQIDPCPQDWRHRPRLTVGRVVLLREAWRFQRPELAFADQTSTAARFTAARAWSKSHGLPRFVFFSMSRYIKPLYVDFDSPPLIDVFARLLNKKTDDTARVTVTEMLPTHSQYWLRDDHGRPCTSEIRMVAFDDSPS